MRKTISLISAVLWLFAPTIAFGDELIGTFTVSYATNVGGCLGDRNPYQCVYVSPGPIHVPASPGRYRVLRTQVLNSDDAGGVQIWSGNATNGIQYTPRNEVEFDHAFGEITFYYHDWYPFDNPTYIGSIVELYRVSDDIPSVSIEDTVAVIKGTTKNIHIVVDPNSISPGQSITLTLSANGSGSATFDDGSSTAVISGSQVVTIRGVTESSTTDNIALVATFDGQAIAEDRFSVLWVRLQMRPSYANGPSGVVAIDNHAGAAYAFAVASDELGVVTTINAAVTGVEFKGAVLPQDFTDTFMFQRRVWSRLYVGNDSDPNAVPENGGPDQVQLSDGDPHSGTSNGVIYDLDSPGYILLSQRLLGDRMGSIRRYRAYFDEWVEFGGVRCSEVIRWYTRQSIIKTNDGWRRFRNVPGDNEVGQGTTALTWNFR